MATTWFPRRASAMASASCRVGRLATTTVLSIAILAMIPLGRKTGRQVAPPARQDRAVGLRPGLVAHGAGGAVEDQRFHALLTLRIGYGRVVDRTGSLHRLWRGRALDVVHGGF